MLAETLGMGGRGIIIILAGMAVVLTWLATS